MDMGLNTFFFLIIIVRDFISNRRGDEEQQEEEETIVSTLWTVEMERGFIYKGWPNPFPTFSHYRVLMKKESTTQEKPNWKKRARYCTKRKKEQTFSPQSFTIFFPL